MSVEFDVAVAIARAELEIAAKAQPRAEVEAVQRLALALQSTFDDAALDLLRELQRLGRVPSNPLTQRQLEALFLQRASGLAASIESEALSAAARGRREMLRELSARTGTQFSFTNFSQSVLNRIRDHVFVASERTLSNVVGNVMGTIAQGYRDGLGIGGVIDLLQDQFEGMSEFDLLRVARTEVQSFQNEGAYETERELGIVYHQWVTAGDERVRPTHEELEGEIVEVGDLFSNGLKHPLDRDGPIEEWIMCRCRAVPYIMSPRKLAPGFSPFFEGDLNERIADKHLDEVHDQATHAGGAGPKGTPKERIANAKGFGLDPAPGSVQVSLDHRREARTYGREQSGVGITKEQLQAKGFAAEVAVSVYTNDSGVINRHLTGKERLHPDNAGPTEGHIAAIDDLISSQVTSEDIVVTRGFGNATASDMLYNMQPGDSFTNPAYTSTALHPAGSDLFVGRANVDGERVPVISQILIPEGSNALFLEDVTEVRGEYEMLLPRGTEFEVVGRIEGVTGISGSSDPGVVVQMIAKVPGGPAVKHLESVHDQQTHAGGGAGFSKERFEGALTYEDELDEEANEMVLGTDMDILVHGMTESEAAALENFIASSWGMNTDLIEGVSLEDSLYEDDIRGMDSLIAKCTVPEDMIVTRGFGFESDVLTTLQPGTEFTSAGFMSTAIHPQGSATFTQTDDEGRVIVAEMMVPEGMNAAYVNGVSGLGEYELVLPRGCTYRVLGQVEKDVMGSESYDFENDMFAKVPGIVVQIEVVPPA